MSRPPRICACGWTVPYEILCPCQRRAERARKARFDKRRPSARERGYNSKWERERAAFLRLHPVCKFCGAPSTTVDHIIRHNGDPALFWNRSNWQALCTRCHNSVKQRQERRPRP